MVSTQQSQAPDRVALVLIDGIGDVTIPAFGDRTPLQVAHVPNMDCIAAAGINGLVDAVEPGLACGSDTSHMNLLGYDPRKYYRGRGAFESMGAGLPMAPGDIAFKSNFATYNHETGIVEKRRADRQFEHLGPELCAALDGIELPSFPEHRVSVKYATEHRCGVVVRGPGLTDAISGTDPLKDNLPLLKAEALDDSSEAKHTAAVVNELSSEIMKHLKQHPINKQRIAEGKNPANAVLLRGCGSRITVDSFEKLHGMKGCLIAPTKIIAGLGMSFDIVSLQAPGATGSYDSHFASKAAVAADALVNRGFDFCMIHVKAVDDTGHDRMLGMKVRFLEVIDRMIGHLLVRLHDAEEQQQQQQQGGAPQQYVVCVTSDHSTPVVFGDHSHEPVPFAVARVQDAIAAMGGLEQVNLRRQYMGVASTAEATGLLPQQRQRQQQGTIQQQQQPQEEEEEEEDTGLQQQQQQQQRSSQQQLQDRIPLPDVKQPPQIDELLIQAEQQQRRRLAAAKGLACSSSSSSEDYGPWPECWPQVVFGDRVVAFDELSAARGCLGRFTSAGVMPLIKQFTRR